MDRINNILQNNRYRLLINKITEQEKNRIYCRHGLDHCLDVARIGWIIAFEEGLEVDKELIYAAALLHDAGRAVTESEDENIKVPHQKQSIIYAEYILKECGFDKSEICIISDAIISHNSNGKDKGGLSYILYKADKLSRNCFDCHARSSCYWPEEEKNKGVIY